MCENKGQDEKDNDVMLKPLILTNIFVNLQQIKDIVACKKRRHRRTHKVAIHKLIGLIMVLA